MTKCSIYLITPTAVFFQKVPKDRRSASKTFTYINNTLYILKEIPARNKVAGENAEGTTCSPALTRQNATNDWVLPTGLLSDRKCAIFRVKGKQSVRLLFLNHGFLRGNIESAGNGNATESVGCISALFRAFRRLRKRLFQKKSSRHLLKSFLNTIPIPCVVRLVLV